MQEYRPNDLSLVGAAAVLLRRPKLVFAYPFLVAVAATALSYLIHPRYSATVTFAPEARSNRALPGGLAAIAGQFGLSFQGEATQSPAFYVEVLHSRKLTEQVLLSRFAHPQAGNPQDSVDLLTLLDVAGDTRAESIAAGVSRLMEAVETEIDPRSGLVRVSVETDWPTLSADIATRFVAFLDRFNTIQRQSQARERRKFIESRVGEFDEKLRGTEEQLRRFYQANRSWQQAPQLVLEEQRLRRENELAQGVFLTLQQQYELSRIEEVNDTPVLTVVDPAVPPIRKSRPRRAVIGVSALVLGVLAGALCAFVAEYLERMRSERSAEVAELVELVRLWPRRVRKPV